MIEFTVNIPVMIDSDDRLFNVNAVVKHIRKSFSCPIHVLEFGSNKKCTFAQDITHSFIKSDSVDNPKTTLLNRLAKTTQTPFFFFCDADVIIPAAQIISACTFLEQGADMVLPYANKACNVTKDIRVQFLEDRVKPDYIHPFMTREDSVGGCVGWNKVSHYVYGMENENFLSWGWEDTEAYMRATKLGLSIKRTSGFLYHLDHTRGHNSSRNNKHLLNNKAEYDKEAAMDATALRSYISTWTWRI